MELWGNPSKIITQIFKPKYPDPWKLAIWRTQPLRHTGSFTLPLDSLVDESPPCGLLNLFDSAITTWVSEYLKQKRNKQICILTGVVSKIAIEGKPSSFKDSWLIQKNARGILESSIRVTLFGDLFVSAPQAANCWVGESAAWWRFWSLLAGRREMTDIEMIYYPPWN